SDRALCAVGEVAVHVQHDRAGRRRHFGGQCRHRNAGGDQQAGKERINLTHGDSPSVSLSGTSLAVAAAISYSCGNTIVAVVPTPSVDSIRSCPPWSFISRREIARPRPVPPRRSALGPAW